jgi:tRNA-2-methylthio-N6-dimethylallyladenosine synthase
VCVAGDVIVGFPTETDDDFTQTCDLIRQGRFKNSFIFKYSPRPGTTAETRLADDVPEPVKRRRNNQALAVQAEVGAAVHAAWVGRRVDVFVEKITRRARHDAARAQLSGRTGGDLITVFEAPPGTKPESLLGAILPVRITAAGPLLLRGTLEDTPIEAPVSISLHVTVPQRS